METPVIKTARITLRPMKISDAKQAFESWTNDVRVAKFMRWSVHKSVKDTEMWLKEEQDNIMGNTYTWGFQLNETSALIGSGGLSFSEKHNCHELGYNLMQEMWGKGLATEAAQRILLFAKEELGAKKIYCCHAVENTASEKVIKKLGFKRFGTETYEKFDKSRSYECITYFVEF